MADDLQAASRFIRARQRDRDAAMVGFSRDLAPAISQVGIDKLEFSVAGRWVTEHSTGAEMFSNLLALDDIDWFNRPHSSQNGRLALGMSRSRNRSTIGGCKVRVSNTLRDRGNVLISFVVNPTRTLANLLVRNSEDQLTSETWRWIEALSPASFFDQAASGLIPALSHLDNWLPPSRHLRDRLGENYWDRFLPIFCDKIRRFGNLLMMEAPVDPINEPINRICSASGVVDLDWGDIRVSTVESYFERYHRQAISVVRRGGNALLAADHSVDFWRYAERPPAFHREDGQFSIGIQLTNSLRLAIYAKLRDRLRFEIRRKGKGDYSRLGAPADGNARLLAILQQERENLLGALNWEEIGELLAGPDHPQMADVGELIHQVCATCDGDADGAAAILNTLLFDGAITEADASPAVIRSLEKRGIVRRYMIRVRDRNGITRRYALAAPYLDIHLAMIDGFSEGAGRR